jgi:hypothetical protein
MRKKVMAITDDAVPPHISQPPDKPAWKKGDTS